MVDVQSLDRQLESLDVQVRSSHQRTVAHELLASVPDDAMHIFVVGGQGAFRPERRVWTYLRSGDVIIAPHGTQQWFVSARGGVLTLTSYEVAITQGTRPSFFDLLEEPVHEHFTSMTELKTLLTRIDEELEHGQMGSRAVTSALMKHSLVLILREHVRRCGSMSIAVNGDARIRRAIACVLDQPAAAHTVVDLAAVAGMSRSAFARHFVSCVKRSPMEFVKHVRLQHAATLLETTELPIKTVAARTGFASRSHFSRAFRAFFGVDPSQFRRTRDEMSNI